MRHLRSLILRIFAWLGTVASVTGLLISFRPAGMAVTFVQGILIGSVSVLFLIQLLLDVWDWRANQPRAFTEKEKINDYLRDWLAGGGRAVIFTRDMSWAHREDIQSLLKEKANNGELTICLPDRIPLSQELAEYGAEIIVYDKIKMDPPPQSRFTIINFQRSDARVAVGRRIGNVHVIEEFSAGEHPAFSIANDLVHLLHAIPKSSRAKN